MGPHGIFCHGASFYSGKSRFHIHVQGLRNIRYPNCLWSPFLEMYRTKKFFVVVTQLLSGLLFGIVALSLNFDYFFAISISTMAVIALSGATHDIACDGVYMAELSPEDQAKYIGVQGAFYNIAKLVANGGLFKRICPPIKKRG